METGSTVPLEIVQLKLQKKIEEHAMAPKPRKSNIVAALGDNDVDDQVDRLGKDLDAKSTTQNFLNVAKQGDLSPRHIDKVKTTAKGRKKQPKDITDVPTGGVQTRRTLTKSNI